MEKDEIPSWLLSLDKNDVEFVRRFVLNSGSLKDMAKDYGVSYPTVRTKLDHLIEKIELHSKEEDVEFINLIKHLVIDEKISLEVAKVIIDTYKKVGRDKG